MNDYGVLSDMIAPFPIEITHPTEEITPPSEEYALGSETPEKGREFPGEEKMPPEEEPEKKSGGLRRLIVAALGAAVVGATVLAPMRNTATPTDAEILVRYGTWEGNGISVTFLEDGNGYYITDRDDAFLTWSETKDGQVVVRSVALLEDRHTQITEDGKTGDVSFALKPNNLVDAPVKVDAKALSIVLDNPLKIDCTEYRAHGLADPSKRYVSPLEAWIGMTEKEILTSGTGTWSLPDRAPVHGASLIPRPDGKWQLLFEKRDQSVIEDFPLFTSIRFSPEGKVTETYLNQTFDASAYYFKDDRLHSVDRFIEANPDRTYEFSAEGFNESGALFCSCFGLVFRHERPVIVADVTTLSNFRQTNPDPFHIRELVLDNDRFLTRFDANDPQAVWSLPTPSPSPVPPPPDPYAGMTDAEILVEQRTWYGGSGIRVSFYPGGYGYWVQGSSNAMMTWAEDENGHVHYTGYAGLINHSSGSDTKEDEGYVPFDIDKYLNGENTIYYAYTETCEGTVNVLRKSMQISMTNPFSDPCLTYSALDLHATGNTAVDARNAEKLTGYFGMTTEEILCSSKGEWIPLDGSYDTVCTLEFSPDGTGTLNVNSFEQKLPVIFAADGSDPTHIKLTGKDGSISVKTGKNSSISFDSLKVMLVYISGTPYLIVLDVLTDGMPAYRLFLHSNS